MNHFNFKEAIFVNWKTTTVGAIMALSGFVALNPDKFGGDKSWPVAISKYAVSGGFISIGIVAKDPSRKKEPDEE